MYSVGCRQRGHTCGASDAKTRTHGYNGRATRARGVWEHSNNLRQKKQQHLFSEAEERGSELGGGRFARRCRRAYIDPYTTCRRPTRRIFPNWRLSSSCGRFRRWGDARTRGRAKGTTLPRRLRHAAIPILFGEARRTNKLLFFLLCVSQFRL